MVSLNTPLCDFGWKAIDFNLQGVDDTFWTLEKSKGENGLLVMFICNHCPYVKAILPRLVHDLRILKGLGIETIAIQSNDPLNYPEDSFENMKSIAYQSHFSFPYVIDETQETARAYNAICTPDFFGFNRNLELQYRGRFDATGRGVPPPDNTHDLFEAMKLIAETQKGPTEQKSSIGCSIKWRE
ncbi:thioredoxin family protein [Candidatus Methylopumilus rimovensis]|uniref:Thioredoxin family protein n=1 Tax=Candidatus Methylopumilus rimovensis TaxID=2588535 RepID=A0AAE6KNV3_9PROT|nr:thioredoxin family protein [Candidatus Methylopumilus rimovensis]QDD13141.1 thioredoxin family protein [Candidatus Methylopumilus rimovensis]